MFISWAFCTHNELEYLEFFLPQLLEWILNDSSYNHEIIILDDFSDEPTIQFLRKFQEESHGIALVTRCKWNNDFSEHKNFMNDLCKKDSFIINLDGDEIITKEFFDSVPFIIQANPDIEAYWVPRVNTVDGITHKHLAQWNWTVSKLENYIKFKFIDQNTEEYHLIKDLDYILDEENGGVTFYQPIICWPDWQCRIYKHDPKIQWKNKVHEQLTGFSKFSRLPAETEMAIQHHKNIRRQELQNKLYTEMNV